MAIFRKPRFVYYSFLINLLTNPAANLIVTLAVLVLHIPYMVILAVVESIVFIVEAILIKKLMELTWPRSLLLSLLLNAATTTVGLLLF